MSITIPVVSNISNAQSTVAVSDPVVNSQSVPFNVGDTTILSSPDNGNGNLIVARQVTLSQAGTLTSLSFYVTTVGGNLRLGVYSDASGSPGTKLAECAEFTPVVGWNTKPTTSTPSLAAGTYWLVYFPQSNALAFVKSNTGATSKYKTLTYGVLPTTFPTGLSTTTSHWSLYATLNGAVQPPDTVAPSVPTNVAGTAVSASVINLTWTASTDNVGVAGYQVFRNGTQVGTPSVNSFSDSGLTANTSYTYTVKAFDVANNISAASVAKAVTTLAAPPPGTPQYPHMLDGYAVRPAWQVAGVEYYVGCPTTTTLKNIANNTDPQVDVNTTQGNVYINGDGYVLDGYDFTHWSVVAMGSNVTIQNCKGSPAHIEQPGASAGGITVRNCTMDSTGDSVSGSQITLSANTGNKVVENNYLVHPAQHFIEINNSGKLSYRFNLLDRGGQVAGAHLNTLQMQTDDQPCICEYNTWYQPAQPAGGEGFQIKGRGGSCSFNTVVTKPFSGGAPGVSFAFHPDQTGGGGAVPGSGFVNGTIQQNFIDQSGCIGVFYGASAQQSGMTVTGNKDMVNGKTINADNSET